MWDRVQRTPCAVSLCVLCLQCSSEPTERSYEFTVKVEGDPGKAVAGATVSINGRRLAQTLDDGRVTVASRGQDGDIRSVQVSCPADYRAPAAPLHVSLIRRVETQRRPEYLVRCEPMHRTVVVAVRAEGGANLPVVYLGREIARTDPAGAAHFTLRLPPEETLELHLDTSLRPELRPRKPGARFRVGQRDEVLVFAQNFHVEAASQRRRVVHDDRPHAIRSFAGRR